MELSFPKTACYQLNEEKRIETADGALYMARDKLLERDVAVKHIRIQGETATARQENYQKAIKEVRAMVKLEDVRRIPRIYDVHYDAQKADLYIIMQWIPGDTLTRRMQGCTHREFLDWMVQLCEIMAEVDRRGVQHKDLKPDNLKINDRNQVWLLDFGISTALPNRIAGTAYYKAPEMAEIGNRSQVDKFSVGVMLYEHFAGRLPVPQVDYTEKRFVRGKWNQFVSPRDIDPTVPEAVNEIVCTCMKRDPRERYRSWGALKNVLKEAMKLYGPGE